MNQVIRKIKQNDNTQLSLVIKSVFREFKIDKPGTVYFDPSTDHLYELFQTPKSCYWLVEEGHNILGGCGIFPTMGLPSNCAELVKFYLNPIARGKGLGKQLMAKSIESAKELGYKQLYLESFPELKKAVRLYEMFGFKPLASPMGNSGHYACNIWMLLEL